MPLTTQTLTKPLITILVLTWDTALFLLNLLLPAHAPGTLIPPNTPGHARTWPPYTPPSPSDSRSACPMLNALANHSILPHSGRAIPFPLLTSTVRATFNFAPSFSFFVPHFAAAFLGRSYWRGSCDLAELSRHNAIEHDASLTRRDSALQGDQGVRDEGLVRRLLGSASGGVQGGRVLTKGDVSRALAMRRREARLSNPQYTESLFHNGFGAANAATMLTIFGGRVEDLEVMLLEERFVEGWEPRVLSRFGLTMMAFNGTVLPVEIGARRAKLE